MEKNIEVGKKLLQELLGYFQKKGATLLPFIKYTLTEKDLILFAEKEDGTFIWPILSFEYRSDRALLAFNFRFPFPVPADKIPKALEIINHLNNFDFENHLSISQQTGLIIVHQGMFVKGDSLDEENFRSRLGGFLKKAHSYMPLFMDKRFPDLKILKDNNLKWEGEVL